MAKIDEVIDEPDASTPPPNTSAAKTYSHPNDGFLKRAHKWLTYAGGLYVFLLVLLTIPFFQLHAVYAHFINWPPFAKFNMPEKYGLAAHKTLNLRLNTTDNVSLGAWLVLSDDYYKTASVKPTAQTVEEHVPLALKSKPTVLFFHGNAANRAVPYRVHHYEVWSTKMGANCLAVDYRGFGDSTGVPSEDGVALDAWAAWDWLVANGAKPSDILVVGHSLGTAVSARFVTELQKAGTRPKGLVLLSPFSSLRTLVDTYYILGLFPLIKPLELIPGLQTALKYFLAIKYDTRAIIADITVPLLIAHAEDDWDIPSRHADVLFEAVLDPHLPPLPEMLKPSLTYHPTEQEWEESRQGYIARREKRAELVKTTVLDRFATIEDFGHARLVQMKYGRHDPFGKQEGLQDVIREYFRLG